MLQVQPNEPELEEQSAVRDDVDAADRSELQPLSLQKINIIPLQNGNQKPKLRAVASRVNFATKVKGGAISVNLCNCYSMHIYLHYWLWQIPFVIINVILCYIWYSTHDKTDAILNLREIGFLAVLPVFLLALVRDKVFLWFIYWSVKHFYCCNQYGRYHFSRLADCIGGLHGSFGVTALLWNIIYFHDCFVREHYQFNIKTITALCLPVLLALISASALPCFRYYYHDAFEILHRCLSWIALCVLVTHLYVMETMVFSGETFIDLTLHVISNPPSMLALLLIIMTLYPWILIHRIKGKNVQIIPSESGDSTALILPIWSPMGAVCKLSLNCVEFHVFGITPMPYDPDKGYHESLVLIKSLGNWSSDLTKRAQLQELDNATFWIHRIKPPNFSQGLFNWSRVFALATGAGIAPLIPYVVHPNHYNVEISLVWVARDHEHNYPQFIIDILKPLSNVVLYDTTKMARTDLSLLTVKKAKEFDAEAVFIVASPKVAYNVANYANKKGIHVFASNWDV